MAHPRDPSHRLVPDDVPLLSGLAILRYRDHQGYGVELLQRRDTPVKLLDGKSVLIEILRPGDKFIEDESQLPAEVTSIRLG